MPHIVNILLIMLLIGCSTQNSQHYTQSLDKWRGRDVNQLLAAFGTPNLKMPAAQGNTLYRYKIETYSSPGGPLSPQVGVNVSRSGRPVIVSATSTNGNRGAIALNCYRNFLVNSQGIIVKAQSQGTCR
jgi:hypothetical protein